MADRALDPAISLALQAARQAIDRGEYGHCLRLLEPLAAAHGPESAIGAGVRLLMATALMGQGQNEQAADCCRSLKACVDITLRAQAKDLLTVLEAPALQRPRHWSLTLPDLGQQGALLEGSGGGGGLAGRHRQRRPPEPPPPVGPTPAPVGFAAIVAVLLAALLLLPLLGGCMEVRTELRFEGPGRLQLSHRLRSDSGQLTPWQRRFAEALHAGPASFRSQQQGEIQLLSTAVLPADQALAALQRSLNTAAELAGVSLPAAVLQLQERNWLVGVRQRLSLMVDLTPLPPLPGVELSLRLLPVSAAAVIAASPQAVISLPRQAGGEAQLLWSLQSGQRNVLELHCWRWSRLGLGGLVIAGALVLVSLLQRIRLRLGFGLPELPA
ncbi:MAG: DUF3153 domain-containing protein [Cyanobacteria bacterium]|nr:DUF3153 domain-containing protein [Cyanobacteriota bacterium]